MSSSTAPQLAPEVMRLSEPQRVINTFVAPSRTFIDIRNNASWWMPWLLLSVMSMLFVFTMGQKVGWERIMQNEIAKNPRAVEQFDKMPAEQRDRAMDMQVTIGKVSGYMSPLILLISALLIAAVLMATFNFGIGATIGYKTALAIVFYGWLPSLVTSLLGMVTLYAGVDPDGFSIRNPVATNPAYFMDVTQHKFLYGMASALDIIVIWSIVLMAIGFSSNSKVKRGTAFAVIFGWYIVVKLIGAGFASAF
ncbi:MAG TPA: YIP1 family protein [Clostridia bacterium]|nr:YIP1 family protein [Clostridia bacterium]